MTFRKEACVENYHEARAAVVAGADQIELCSALDLDGLSPHEADIIMSMTLDVPIKVMIRLRGGDFVYSRTEGRLMIEQIYRFKDMGVQHFVIGMLTKTGEIDFTLLESSRAAAGDSTICFHKAIDSASDIIGATRNLVISGLIDSLLSSGGYATALEGAHNLLMMKDVAGKAVEIIPAGKITYHNILDIHEILDCRTYHGRRIVEL